MTVDSHRRQVLEDQRAFLLTSLRDLEEEHRAGDLDEDDYRTLKDDYTARAAGVIRELDGRGRPRTSESRNGVRAGVGWRRPVWIASTVGVALLAGLLMVQASDTRGSEDTATGDIRESTFTQLRAADSCLAERDLECASRSYEEVLVQDPNNLDALTYGGWTYFQMGEYDRALDHLAQATTVDPTYLDAWTFRALALTSQDRSDELLSTVEQLVATGGFDIALALSEQLEAMAFGGAIATSATNPALTLIQVYDGILADESALEGPQLAIVLARRGALLFSAGAVEEALTYVERAVESDPDSAEAYAYQALIADQADDAELAAAALERFDALEVTPELEALIDSSGIRDRR